MEIQLDCFLKKHLGLLQEALLSIKDAKITSINDYSEEFVHLKMSIRDISDLFFLGMFCGNLECQKIIGRHGVELILSVVNTITPSNN